VVSNSRYVNLCILSAMFMTDQSGHKANCRVKTDVDVGDFVTDPQKKKLLLEVGILGFLWLRGALRRRRLGNFRGRWLARHLAAVTFVVRKEVNRSGVAKVRCTSCEFTK
jgi:hypothetical protein